MKRLFIILIIFLTGTGLFATGWGNPNLHLTNDTVYITGNSGQGTLTFVNHLSFTGADSIELRWEVIQFDVPTSWSFGFCAGLDCYVLNATSTNTFWIHAGNPCSMSFDVNPNNFTGNGTIRIAVYPAGGSVNDGVIITNVMKIDPVSINRTPVVNFSMYPNPVKDYININFTRKGTQHIEIYNILGNKVLIKDIENADFIRIPFSNFLRGRYIVMYRSDNGKVITKSISKE